MKQYHGGSLPCLNSMPPGLCLVRNLSRSRHLHHEPENYRMKYAFLILVSILFIGTTNAQTRHTDMANDLETSVCGMKEPILFWLWSTTAGRSDPQRLAGLRGVDDIIHTTRDGRQLRGYRLTAHTEPAKGFLLILQGNAILADQLIDQFMSYARAGYDVYMYDYRGYGRSDGKRRLKAMVSDTREILAALNAKPYARRLVYAFSFGGILLLDAYEAGSALDKVVIDSSPARLSDYGCPQEFDPIANLPTDCSRFLFIMGLQDDVVTPSMTRPLLEQAETCKAQVVRDMSFRHPFMDPDPTNHQRRMKLIEDFLLQ